MKLLFIYKLPGTKYIDMFAKQHTLKTRPPNKTAWKNQKIERSELVDHCFLCISYYKPDFENKAKI